MKTVNVDVIIIGGSYAGLSAAMSLGRSLRSVLVIDHGTPCNKQTPHSHNFITHDGATPASISEKAKSQVSNYKTVSFYQGKAVKVLKKEHSFSVETEAGDSFQARKLIFATGLSDTMSDIKGFAQCWGISAIHCPYCHGYEFTAERTGILANGDGAFEASKMISHWTKDLFLFTNGASTLTAEQTSRIQKKNITIIEKEIAAIEHTDGYIQQLVFKDGTTHALKALYARLPFKQQSELPELLGCEFTEQGLIKADQFQKTTVNGVYAAGDSTNWGRAVSLSVESGALAGMSCNREMIDEDFH